MVFWYQILWRKGYAHIRWVIFQERMKNKFSQKLTNKTPFAHILKFEYRESKTETRKILKATIKAVFRIFAFSVFIQSYSKDFVIYKSPEKRTVTPLRCKKFLCCSRCMYSWFWNIKYFCSTTYCCVVVDYILSNLKYSIFYIVLHFYPHHNFIILYNIWVRGGGYAELICNIYLFNGYHFILRSHRDDQFHAELSVWVIQHIFMCIFWSSYQDSIVWMSCISVLSSLQGLILPISELFVFNHADTIAVNQRFND